MRYITKTKIIRAFQLTEEMLLTHAFPEWADPYFSVHNGYRCLMLKSGHKVFVSDWLIKHHSGVWVLSDPEFKREFMEW